MQFVAFGDLDGAILDVSPIIAVVPFFHFGQDTGQPFWLNLAILQLAQLCFNVNLCWDFFWAELVMNFIVGP